MKTRLFLALSVLATAVATSCSGSKNPEVTAAEATNEQLSRENAALAAANDSLQQLVADREDLLSILSDMEDASARIKDMQHLITVPDISSDAVNRGAQLRNDMSAIEQSIADQKARLADLEAKLSQSDNTNGKLRQTINSLRTRINEQQQELESLRSELAIKNVRIDSLTQTVATTQQDLEEALRQRDEADRESKIVYYVFGSKSELKEHDIIESGFLRKTKILPDNFEKDYFTVADRTTLTEIPLYSKKAKVLTSQPESSYSIERDSDGIKTLIITDPEKFWDKSNYLVIQTD